MLQSYPRTQLGKWTPNRARIRYSAEEATGREFKRFDNGENAYGEEGFTYEEHVTPLVKELLAS